ncbi:MAG: anaerobic ribonucleoside-triphosphate reductase activating protein [Clostridiales bacterium]|nr:anaerobic ribonucleoside-triphosphate reductase activating protein [Clostridiales bacterium]
MGTIRLAGFVGDSIVDGPGIRAVVFTQGCPHRCEGCHNPESWDFNGGYDMDTEEIFEKICSNPLCKGVTFSGGEPFCQARELKALAERIKEKKLELAIYTGYTFETLMFMGDKDIEGLISLADVIIDGPFIREKRNLNLRFRGSENQRIIDVKKTLHSGYNMHSECNVQLVTEERWIGEA